MESHLTGFSNENGSDFFGNGSTGNGDGEPFDYSMDQVNTQEQIMSPSPAHKLLNPMNESPSYPTLNFDEIGTPLLPTGLDKTILDPQRSEGAPTPSKITTAPVKHVIEEPVPCSSLSSSSPQPVERSIGSKSLLGPNCTSRNATMSEITAEGHSVPIDPQSPKTRPPPWISENYTPEKAMGDMTLPSTDLDGALSSLQPQCWLSSTAIELVLSLCSSKSFRVFDPLAYDVGQPEIKNFKPTPSNVQYALLPLYYREHWTLALFDLENHTITCYDSLPGQNSIAHKDALLKFANYLTVETFQWTFQYGSQAKQENFYDCGVFLLVTSLHIFAGSTCPLFYDCSLWRALFHALLTVKCQTELPTTKWRLSSSTSIDDENDGMWFLVVFHIPLANNLLRPRLNQKDLSKPQAATRTGEERRGSC